MEKISTIIDLEAALRALHQARVVAAGYRTQKAISYEAWKAEHAALFEGLETAEGVLAASEAQARDLALAAYKETGDKRPVSGVEVKEFAPVRIPNEAVALAWAIKHELALKLDTAALGKIAKAQGGIPGVALVMRELQATIATDLSKFVTEEVAP